MSNTLIDLLKEVPLSAVLKEKVTARDEEIASLKQENAFLKDENHKLQTENKRLKEQIDSFTHPDTLHETEKEILIYLADDNTINFNDSMLIGLKLNQTRLDYFVHSLTEKHYVYYNGSYLAEGKYELTQRGRDYLFKNNLI